MSQRVVKAIRASDGLPLWVLESRRYRRFAERRESEPAPRPDVVWQRHPWLVRSSQPPTVRPGSGE